jgi:glycosyltransferase involved in cell wall biosynthesis
VSNKVLIITYYWPPSGGAGVQRWLKFAKYLPEFGWQPVILTVDPEFAAYPVTDNSLLDDLPSGLKIVTTLTTNYFSIYKKDSSKIPTAGFANSVDNTLKGKLMRFIRGNFFIPDPRKGWNKFAYKNACDIIESEKIDHIITTSPPHSTQLIGLKLKRKYPRIKWIADLRDPWTDIYYYEQFYPTIISKAIDRNYEKRVLKEADHLITVGKSLKELFLTKVKGIEKNINVITNGYDETDFEGIEKTIPKQPVITYVGTLSDIYPLDGLLEALSSFRKKGNELLIRFIGTVSQNQKTKIVASTGGFSTEFIPTVSHYEAIRYMTSSTLLLLIIPEHRSNKSIITGKIFEYIATGRPVLCLGPANGDAADIIRYVGIGNSFNYHDSESIEEFLEKSSEQQTFNIKRQSEFSRKELTKKIVSILNNKV